MYERHVQESVRTEALTCQLKRRLVSLDNGALRWTGEERGEESPTEASGMRDHFSPGWARQWNGNLKWSQWSTVEDGTRKEPPRSTKQGTTSL